VLVLVLMFQLDLRPDAACSGWSSGGTSRTEVEAHQENNKLLDWLELAPLVVPALQHLSWLYVDMPESSTGAGASWARKLLAPVFRARPST